MNAETESFPHGDIRVSDAERDLAVAELGEHFQAGRLTQDEFDDRSGRALQARTGTDLNGLFTDLPHHARLPVPPAAYPAEDPYLGAGNPPPPGGLRVARAVIAFAVAVLVASIVLGGHGYGHGHGHAAAWLILVAILGFVFLRIARLAGRR
jgi:DUF1707 SHOCT-like domain